MSAVLKPCPFCGGDPTPDYSSIIGEHSHLFHCQSGDCPAWPNVSGDSEEEAILAWNTRYSAPNDLADDVVRAFEVFNDAEHNRSDCEECEGDGNWTECGPCSERVGALLNAHLLAIEAYKSGRATAQGGAV